MFDEIIGTWVLCEAVGCVRRRVLGVTEVKKVSDEGVSRRRQTLVLYIMKTHSK